MAPSVESLEAVTGDGAALRRAYSCFPSGVAALCAQGDDAPVGLAASSFTTVSVDPPLVSVCVQNTSETWPRLRGHPRIGVSVLAEGHDALCVQLSSKTGDRFADVERTTTDDGCVLLAGATAWLDCSLYDELPAGDHLIALLQIHRMTADPDAAPLVFHGSAFRRLHTSS